jgi:putative lipoprotein
MSLNISDGKGTLTHVVVVALFGLCANAAMAQSIQGTATYRERMALPSGAVLEATLEDVARADAPATTIASTRVTSPGNPPIAFTITYDPTRIVQTHRYAVRAKILVDGKLLFTSDTEAPVITQGSPTTVSLMLRRVSAGQASGSAVPLEQTYWRATELAGKPVPAQPTKQEAHLQFQKGRVSGSDGCNRITGRYELKAAAMTFGPMAGTQMACMQGAEIERAFRAALKGTTRWAITGSRLELFDASNARLAAFDARAQTPLAASKSPLQGTAWQLVKFQSNDDTTQTPDDRAKYTIEFNAGGQLVMRLDCNRGRGTWKSSGPNQVQLGPLALTRAKCPEGSLHDLVVKHLSLIRSFVIKDGHLFLALMADGGTYEFEPLVRG